MDLSTISTGVGILGSLSGIIYLCFYFIDRKKQIGVRPSPPPLPISPPLPPSSRNDGGSGLSDGRTAPSSAVPPTIVDGATEFTKNEPAYQKWLEQHPQGFVVNTHAKPDKRKEYAALHKASCSSISRYSDRITPGAYTERDFVKVCSHDVESLARWAMRIGRTNEPFSGICGLCKPSTPLQLSNAVATVAPITAIASTNAVPQIISWTPQEFATILESCRALPSAKGSYIINDYVENILLTVLDFQMKTPIVQNAARHYLDRVKFQINDYSDLQKLLSRFPDDKEGNTQVAQYLWGYNLWTRVALLRRLLKYLGERGITTQEKLKTWAFQSNYERDMAGKVKGIGFGIYKWLVMRQGVETIKPDIWVHRFIKKSIGHDLNDNETVEILEAAAKEIGLKAYELDWRIWESQRGATS